MHKNVSRRGFLVSNGQALVLGAGGLALPKQARGQPAASPAPNAPASLPAVGARWPGFPQQDPSLVREMVGASHGNTARVRELLRDNPELAKASYDWGFGDWESALGAAAHVGNREIAELLLANGARLDLFAAAMLGMLDVVKAALAANPDLARHKGPHSINLLSHAQAGKNAPTIEFLKGIPGATDPNAAATEAETAAYIGTYAGENGGPGVIASKTRFGLAIKIDTAGANDRTLVRTGDYTFHPVGAPSVRVVFHTSEGVATRVEITQANRTIKAFRAK